MPLRRVARILIVIITIYLFITFNYKDDDEVNKHLWHPSKITKSNTLHRIHDPLHTKCTLQLEVVATTERRIVLQYFELYLNSQGYSQGH